MADVKPEDKPVIMPWQENYDLKPAQAVVPPEQGFVGRAVEAVQTAVEGVKNGKMPWELDWKEKPRTSFPKASPKPSGSPANIDSFTAKLEGVESRGNPLAKNPDSTATGLHQFTAGTWTDTVAAMGKNYTLADRTDPVKSREVFKFFTQQNAKAAESDLGRKPTDLDLYMYHFLGSGAAGNFLKAPRDSDATAYVSTSAALANQKIFYKGSKSRTVGEVLDRFKEKF